MIFDEIWKFATAVAPTLGVGGTAMLVVAVWAYQRDVIVSGARYREHRADCLREVERERARGDRLMRHALMGLGTADRGVALMETLRDDS